MRILHLVHRLPTPPVGGAELHAASSTPPSEADWADERHAEFKARWREAREQEESPEEEAPAPIGKELRAALRTLYRSLARRFHPDLGDGEEEVAARHAMMAKINDAYNAGDLDALQRLADEPDLAPLKDESVGERLVRLIRQIAKVKTSLAEAQAALRALESSQGAELLRQCRGEDGQEDLSALTHAVQEEVAAKQARWRELRALEAELWLELDS